MRDIVVIGHPEIVESGLGCPVEHLRWPRIAVGVERVAMEIAAEPPWPGLGQRIGVNAATPEAGGLPRRTQTRVEPDLDFPIAAVWSDLVRTEQDVPRSRADLPLAVRRRRPTFVDREFHLVAAAPAAETGAAFGDPAFVEESDVQRVSATDQRIRVDLIAVRIADVKLAPAGLRQLHIRYSYSEQIDSDPLIGGGNTLDIGLFDERGIVEGSPGFRGWSGSNKMEFTIDEGWATPPYRKGKIGAGTWHVLLGPYKVGPRGCDWKVQIWFDPGLRSPWKSAGFGGRRLDPDPLPDARPGWLRGDLHCHTLYSAGDSWPPEMLNAAAEAGLDFLGVTDHNNVAHQLAYGPGGDGLPIVLPGVEVTTYGGHWNAWGTDRWWEFREPEAKAVERAMRTAAESGAVVSICHPKPFGPPWEYDVPPVHGIEVWNSDWVKLNS